jgi:predicted transcriptional regulator
MGLEMDASRVLRQARRRAGLTQRQLASKAGVPQPMIARIESGAVIPRVDTLDKLLEACGEGLESHPRPGRGLDRTLPRELLQLSPAERARHATQSNLSIMRLREHARAAAARTG